MCLLKKRRKTPSVTFFIFLYVQCGRFERVNSKNGCMLIKNNSHLNTPFLPCCNLKMRKRNLRAFYHWFFNVSCKKQCFLIVKYFADFDASEDIKLLHGLLLLPLSLSARQVCVFNSF